MKFFREDLEKLAVKVVLEEAEHLASMALMVLRVQLEKTVTQDRLVPLV